MPYTIAVCHQKGGVAKTTTVTSLGASLAEAGFRVLLLDLDPSANLTAGLGIQPASLKKSAADLLLGNDAPQAIIRPTQITDLDIIPSNNQMATVSRFLRVRPRFEWLLRTSLEQSDLAGYDWILIDCPPNLGSITTTAVVAADLALIPTQCEYFALQALNDVFQYIRTIRTQYNSGLAYRLLVTMYDLRGNLHQQVLKMVQAHYGNALLQTRIGFDSKLRASQTVGVPITVYASKTRAAHQYRSLASEILAYVEEKTTQQPA